MIFNLPAADLAFAAVVKLCRSVLLVSTTVDTLRDASLETALSAGGAAEAVIPEATDRSKVGLLRMWCLVEASPSAQALSFSFNHRDVLAENKDVP